MNPQKADLSRVLEAIEKLSSDVARLEGRIALLESAPAAPHHPPVAAGGTGAHSARIDSETVMTISAAIAAYLGKKPRIRAIRLLGSEAWAQQGRASIQAWYSVSPNPTR